MHGGRHLYTFIFYMDKYRKYVFSMSAWQCVMASAERKTKNKISENYNSKFVLLSLPTHHVFLFLSFALYDYALSVFRIEWCTDSRSKCSCWQESCCLSKKFDYETVCRLTMMRRWRCPEYRIKCTMLEWRLWQRTRLAVNCLRSLSHPMHETRGISKTPSCTSVVIPF